MTKKKKSARALRSEENKRKWAEKNKAEAEARAEARAAKKPKKKTAKKKAAKKPTIKKPATKKPAIEKSDVETKPWPQAGDNEEFEKVLKDFHENHGSPPKPDAAQTKEPEDAVLKISDVAEWVKWPFQLWSTSQGLPPIIEPREALEIAEPLTRIMNRHGVSEHIPPDVIDGMQVIGRTIPVIKRGNNLVKMERKIRANAGGQAAPRSPAPQGAKVTKPIEVGGG